MADSMHRRPPVRILGLVLVGGAGLVALGASLMDLAPVDVEWLWPSVAFAFAVTGWICAGALVGALLVALLATGCFAWFGHLPPGFAVVGLELLGLWLWLRLAAPGAIPLPLIFLLIASLAGGFLHVGLGAGGGAGLSGDLLSRPLVDAQLLALSMLLVGQGAARAPWSRWLAQSQVRFALVFLLAVLPAGLLAIAVSRGALAGLDMVVPDESLRPLVAMFIPLVWALVAWSAWRSLGPSAAPAMAEMPAAWSTDSPASAQAPGRGAAAASPGLLEFAGQARGESGFFVMAWRRRADGEWTTVDPSAEGAAPQSLERWQSTVHPGDVAVHDRLVESLGRGEEASGQIRLNLSGEGWRWFHVHAAPMKRTPAAGEGLLLHLDINSVKETERQLVQSSKMAVLGEMAAGVAHEINQPLNVIRLATQNLRRRIGDEPVETDYYLAKLDRIAAQTRRAADIIDHMRIFGRKPSDDPEPFSPVRSARRVVELLQSQFDADGIRAVVDCEAEQSMIWGHESLFEQVMMNLLVNARDAINADASSDSREIFILCSHPSGNELELRVRDTGGGMPEAVRERLFQPFFTTKPAGKGTGLGLSLSYGIIQDMNGEIAVRNVAGGAEFCLRLPLTRTPVEPGA